MNGEHQHNMECLDNSHRLFLQTECSCISFLVTDAIGRDGMQLFIDAGQPVDNGMVNKLIQEVLSEKISGMLSQAPEDQKEVGIKTSKPTVIETQDDYKPVSISSTLYFVAILFLYC